MLLRSWSKEPRECTTKRSWTHWAAGSVASRHYERVISNCLLLIQNKQISNQTKQKSRALLIHNAQKADPFIYVMPTLIYESGSEDVGLLCASSFPFFWLSWLWAPPISLFFWWGLCSPAFPVKMLHLSDYGGTWCNFFWINEQGLLDEKKASAIWKKN